MRKRARILLVAAGVVALLGVQTASAAALYGEVVGAANPALLMPGETFTIELTIDTEGSELSLWEGTVDVLGGNITGDPNIRFGIANVTAFFTRTGNSLITSQTLVNTGGTVVLYDLPVDAGDGSAGFQLQVAGFAQRDVAGGVADTIRIGTPTFVEFRAGELSLGTQLAVVPEPGTIFLLGLGLTSLAVYGRRRRTE